MSDVKDSASLPPPRLVSTDYWNRNYLVLNHLGEGAFGTVDQCLKRDTGETVAVKTIKCSQHHIIGRIEVDMLQKLRSLDPDKCNIVRFHEYFQTSCSTSLVFEALDISLFEYMELRAFIPLELNDIRTITQQLASAFIALKSVGVIHTDVKPDNIMLVDRWTSPLKVKLIDFGLAIETNEAKPGSLLQASFYRSPEILLGLPFSEAIDMWSLGCVMFDLHLGFSAFPGLCEYDVMRFIVQLLGQPADHLLDAGLRTGRFFRRLWIQGWSLWPPQEFAIQTGTRPRDTRFYKFRSLDTLKEESLGEETRAGADDIREFVDLMKVMLEMDASKRITPSEVLTHPFITMSHLNGSSHSSHSEALPPATTMQRDCETVDEEQSQPGALEPTRSQTQTRSQDTGKKTEADDCTGETSTTPQPRVILVQPGPFMNSMQEDGATEQQSDNHLISPQPVLNKTPSCPETVDDSVLKLESVTDTDMATAKSLSETDMAAAVYLKLESLTDTDMAAAVSLKLEPLTETDMAAAKSLSETDMAAAVSLKLEPLTETDMAAATTEVTPSLNATEVRAPAIAAVDSAAVDTTSVPLSSAAAAAALNQTENHLDNTESCHTTSEVSKPKEKKKKKRMMKGIRRFFSRMMKALRCCCVPKEEDVE